MRIFCVNTEKKIKHNNTKSQWPAHALNRHTHPLWTGNNFWPSVDNLSHTVPHSGAHCASARLKCIKNSLDICIYIIYIRIYIRCIFIYIHPLKGTWPGKELRHSGLKNKNKLQIAGLGEGEGGGARKNKTFDLRSLKRMRCVCVWDWQDAPQCGQGVL